MGFTVDIDTGGTFTDGFVSDGIRVERVKVDTTPHDLTVCFLSCISTAGKQLGFEDVSQFLKNVDVVRYSTTVGTNAIVQRKGAKLGLIVTKGQESSVYGNSERLFDYLIQRDMVISVDGSIGSNGEIAEPLDEGEVLLAIKKLLDRGARYIVVSLFNAHINDAHEKQVRHIVEQHYPKHYLGSTPVALASEFCNRPDEMTRTNLSLLNGYIHKNMVRYLYKAEDDLRALGYKKPLLTVHSNGGVARVAKTRAVDTLGSGPVAGFMGALEWIGRYGLSKVVTMDVGGTSLDVAAILGGELLLSQNHDLFGLPVDTPLVDVLSRVGGGGTIAKVDSACNTVILGPESAGARPGPACYDLGGSLPTPTDAAVILNYIDPEYYLGGKRQLNVAQARKAIDRGIATVLGKSTEQAAQLIVNELHDRMAQDMREVIEATGSQPADFVMFAYGGGGATNCCAVAERLGIRQVYTFPASPVFSAFGSSTMGALHIYERSVGVPLAGSSASQRTTDVLSTVLCDAEVVAKRDLRAEGFASDDVGLTVELEVNIGQNRRALITLSELPERMHFTERELLAAYHAQCSLSDKAEPSACVIEVARLKAAANLPKNEPRTYPLAASANGDSFKSSRPVFWGSEMLPTPVYDLESLEAGQSLQGPAVLESPDTTHVLPRGWTCYIDKYMNRVIEWHA